jgi:hypothetical protein
MDYEHMQLPTQLVQPQHGLLSSLLNLDMARLRTTARLADRSLAVMVVVVVVQLITQHQDEAVSIRLIYMLESAAGAVLVLAQHAVCIVKGECNNVEGP